MNDSQHVDLLLRRSQQAIKSTSLSPRHRKAMELFWNKKYTEAVDEISLHILEEPGDHELFLSYRLWIECLAIQGSMENLRALAGHLVQMSQYDSKNHSTFVSLGGLAYLEADNFGKSRLLARCVLGNFKDPYVLELIQRLRLRAGHSEKHPIILRCETGITDYFHWELINYALGLQKEQDEDLLLRVNKLMKFDLNAKLISNIMEYHNYLEGELYAGAAVVADILHQDYPDEDVYLVYQGFAYFEDGDYPSARKKLTDYVKKHPRCDFRIIGLLGICHGKLGDTEQAIEILEESINVGAIEGGAVSDLMIEMSSLRDELSLASDDTGTEAGENNIEIQNWLIKLNPSRYYDLMNSPENLIDRIVLPLGSNSRIGDYVFFAASESIENDEFWNIVALYRVDSLPVRHSRFEYVSVLKLVSRLPLTIPIDVEIGEEMNELKSDVISELGWNFDRYAVKKLARIFGLKVPRNFSAFPKGYPYRYGVYQLDEGALELIEKSIEKQTEHLQDRRQRYLSKRPTA
jgi:tetratricopeptide (TPR) repeat protein